MPDLSISKAIGNSHPGSASGSPRAIEASLALPTSLSAPQTRRPSRTGTARIQPRRLSAIPPIGVQPDVLHRRAFHATIGTEKTGRGEAKEAACSVHSYAPKGEAPLEGSMWDHLRKLTGPAKFGQENRGQLQAPVCPMHSYAPEVGEASLEGTPFISRRKLSGASTIGKAESGRESAEAPVCPVHSYVPKVGEASLEGTPFITRRKLSGASTFGRAPTLRAALEPLAEGTPKLPAPRLLARDAYTPLLRRGYHATIGQAPRDEKRSAACEVHAYDIAAAWPKLRERHVPAAHFGSSRRLGARPPPGAVEPRMPRLVPVPKRAMA